MDETTPKIRVYGDASLRKGAKPVKRIQESHRKILSSMSRLMYASSGIGLAAPQIGIADAMIVADIGSGLYKLVNPKIVKKEGAQMLEEGCLSVPGVCIKVKRAQKIIIKALNELAQPVTVEAQDLLACVLQHEIDHLKGKLIVDYASFIDKLKIRTTLRALKRRVENERVSEQDEKSCKLQL